jgi:hypothetical protein
VTLVRRLLCLPRAFLGPTLTRPRPCLLELEAPHPPPILSSVSFLRQTTGEADVATINAAIDRTISLLQAPPTLVIALQAHTTASLPDFSYHGGGRLSCFFYLLFLLQWPPHLVERRGRRMWWPGAAACRIWEKQGGGAYVAGVGSAAHRKRRIRGGGGCRRRQRRRARQLTRPRVVMFSFLGKKGHVDGVSTSSTAPTNPMAMRAVRAC